MTGPPAETHDEPLYDEQAEADSFDEFYKALTAEAQKWGISPDAQLALAAILTTPHARLWAKLRDSGRQANIWADAYRAEIALRAAPRGSTASRERAMRDMLADMHDEIDPGDCAP